MVMRKTMIKRHGMMQHQRKFGGSPLSVKSVSKSPSALFQFQFQLHEKLEVCGGGVVITKVVLLLQELWSKIPNKEYMLKSESAKMHTVS